MNDGKQDVAEFDSVCARLRAFIFPNVPVSAFEINAFDRAARMQFAYERKQRQLIGELPQGVSSFTIGHFSATLEGGSGDALTRKTICAGAYDELLRAGLLYRGLEGRLRPCPSCPDFCEREP